MDINTIQTYEEIENEYHEKQKAKWREYENRPETKRLRKEYYSKPDTKERLKKYWQDPEVKERKLEQIRTPENKAKKRIYDSIRYVIKREIDQSYKSIVADIIKETKSHPNYQ